MKKETLTAVVLGTVIAGGISLYDKITGKDILGRMKKNLGGETPEEQVIVLDDMKSLYDKVSKIEDEVEKTQNEVEAINRYLIDDQTFKQMEENHLVTTKQLDDIKKMLEEIKSK